MPPTDSRALEARIYDIVEQHYNSTFSYTGGKPDGYTLALERHRRDGIEKVQALLSAAPQSDGWRPIAEAPKDGTQILVYCDHGTAIAHWQLSDLGHHHWCVHTRDGRTWRPTHFMPLPTPPKMTQTEGQSHGE